MSSEKEIKGSKVADLENDEEVDLVPPSKQSNSNDSNATPNESKSKRWAFRNKMRYDNKHVLMRFGGGGNKAEPKGVYMTVTSDVPCLKVPNKENTNKFAKSVKKSFTPKNVKQNIKEQMNSKTPKMQVASVSVSTSAALKMIDTFDRPGDSEANKTFSRSDKYAWCEDKHGRRIPKAGAFAEAGVGEAKAEYRL